MAATMQGALLLALVMSCIWVIDADSTIQNDSYTPVFFNGRRLNVGEIRKIGVETGKSTTTIDLSYVRNVTGIQIRNGREYFVITNQSGSTGFLYGREVQTLDLIEGRKIETAF